MDPILTEDRPPLVSVIIPSLDGHRGGAVVRLLESIDEQTFCDYEIYLIKSVAPQGKAINQGAEKARGEILIIMDDDSRLADGDVFQRLVDVLKQDEAVGMAGASLLAPPESNAFQVAASRQFPRLVTPEVEEVTDSDFPCHGCCALRAQVFRSVGGEREDILRGLDPDLRTRLREAGYRVVLVPGARIYHPLPENGSALLRNFFRNGFGSAYAQKFHPESVYDTHEELDSKEFQPRRSLAFRMARFPIRLLKALAQGEGIRFAAYCSYALGYIWAFGTAKEMTRDECPSD